MQSYQNQQGNAPFHTPPIINPPPRIFGAGDPNGSPLSPNFLESLFSAEDQGAGLDESNEAKRRRIARVRDPNLCTDQPMVDRGTAGV